MVWKELLETGKTLLGEEGNQAEVLAGTDIPQDSWGWECTHVCMHVISCICAALCRE